MTRAGAAAQKLPQNRFLRRLKIRRFNQNQVEHTKLIAQNVENNEISQLTNFGSKTLTHIEAAYAFSKFDQDFQNRTPRESDKNFDIAGISVSY